jgi:drug/metabolite transporter (DMT)-like permease
MEVVLMSTGRRTLFGIIIGFVTAFVVALLNGQTFVQALSTAAIFAVIVGVLVAVLSWAMNYAVMKGYPGWLGFVLVFILNVIGIIILFLLPARRPA